MKFYRRGSDVAKFFFKIWHETFKQHKEGWEYFSSRSVDEEKLQKQSLHSL